MSTFLVGFGIGGMYVVTVFVVIHLLGWPEDIEQHRKEMERANRDR